MEMTAYDNIVRAKVQLQVTKPFFSFLVMNLKCIETNEVPSMGIDMQGHLYYNKKWVEKLTEKQCEGVLVHEILHCVLQHLYRCGGRDGELFNCSNDLIVNDILVTECLDLPEGLVPDYEHKFFIKELNYTLEKINEKNSEQIYDELYRLMKKQRGGKGKGKSDGTSGMSSKRFDKHIYADKNGDDESKGKGKEGKGSIGKKLSEDEIKKLEKIWKDRLAEATSYAQQRGLMPKGMERLIDGILESKVNWRHKLYKYITNELPTDYNWIRPSKKSLVTGIYLPSVVKEKIEMVVSVDTSGSIQQKELTEFLSEICSISRSFTNVEMELIIGDAKLQNRYLITNGNINTIMGLQIKGGGGTSHKFVREFIENEKPNCKLLISLTDGYSDIETEFLLLPNSCHRLIVITENGCDETKMQPYGETIKLR